METTKIRNLRANLMPTALQAATSNDPLRRLQAAQVRQQAVQVQGSKTIATRNHRKTSAVRR